MLQTYSYASAKKKITVERTGKVTQEDRSEIETAIGVDLSDRIGVTWGDVGTRERLPSRHFGFVLYSDLHSIYSHKSIETQARKNFAVPVKDFLFNFTGVF